MVRVRGVDMQVHPSILILRWKHMSYIHTYVTPIEQLISIIVLSYFPHLPTLKERICAKKTVRLASTCLI